MSTAMLLPLLVALFAAAQASAADADNTDSDLDKMSVPTTITAGEEFQISTPLDPLDLDEPSLNLTARFYLLHQGGFISDGFAPMCYLSDIVPVSSIPSALTIPKEAGPPQPSYRIKLHIFDNYGHGFHTSNEFALEGTDVDAFSPQEWRGPAWEYDSIPCSAMQCNRRCKESAFATQTRRVEFAVYCECLAGCPGVTTDTPNYDDGCGWDWRYMKTSTSTEGIESATRSSSTATQKEGSIVTSTAPGTTTTTLAAAASQPTVTSNAPLPSSTGGAAQPMPTAHAFLALWYWYADVLTLIDYQPYNSMTYSDSIFT